MMDYNKIIENAKAKGITEIEFLVKNSTSQGIKTFNSTLEGTSYNNFKSYSIRGIYNNKMGYVYTESLEENEVNIILEKLIASAMSNTSTELEFIYDNKNEVYQKIESNKCDSFSHKNTEKIDYLINLENDLKVSDLISTTMARYSEASSTTKLINSKGTNLERSSSYNSIMVSAVATKKDVSKNGYAFDISTDYLDFDKSLLISDATKETLASLEAVIPDSAVHEVIIKNDVMTDLLEAFSPMFFGTALLKKLTKLDDKLNKKVFGENITIIDNPFYENSVIKPSFDDEGVACKETVVVENGIFKNFLHNLKTANAANSNSTGNGFMSSSSISVVPTTMYLKNGNLTKEQLISSINKGIYLTSLQGLHAGISTVSGDFSLQASGFMIEDGQIKEAITLFVVTGNFFDLMNNITELASDIPKKLLSYGAPSVKVSALSISGK